MSKILSKIWRMVTIYILWPDLGLICGLGLLLDNWGHNHAILIIPASVLFIISLRAFVREENHIHGKD